MVSFVLNCVGFICLLHGCLGCFCFVVEVWFFLLCVCDYAGVVGLISWFVFDV